LVRAPKEFAQEVQCIFHDNRAIGAELDDDADEAEDDAFHDRRDYYTLAEAAILSSIAPEMRDWFYTT
jgi:hypothetical protein